MGILVAAGIFFAIGFIVLLCFTACAAAGRADEIILREIHLNEKSHPNDCDD